MYLLDANVVSELRKVRSGTADRNVSAWADSVDAAELYVSVVTLQELEVGVLLAERRDPRQGAVLRTWLNNHVLPAFPGRVLPVDLPIAMRSAALHVPNPRPVVDAMIAATAIIHGLTVVTRDASDFERMGVAILNPWVRR
jgi:hypothetical protein